MKVDLFLFLSVFFLLNGYDDVKAQEMDIDPSYTPAYWCQVSGGRWENSSDFEEEHHCVCPLGLLDSRDVVGRGICVADPRYQPILLDLADAESRGR